MWHFLFWSVAFPVMVFCGYRTVRFLGDGTRSGTSRADRAGDRLRDLRLRWADWRDQPRGPGPQGTGMQDADAAAEAAAASVPVPPPPAPLPPPRDIPPFAPPPHSVGPAGDPAEASVGAAQSDLLHSVTYLVNLASNGDIRDVRRVVMVLAAAADGLGGAFSHLGNRLAEPDKHYGAEIWEPLIKASAQGRAMAIYAEQAGAMTDSLLQTTVGELADSPRQAPHHSQLNGGT